MLFRNNCNKVLVCEMLDRLPPDVWVSDTTTFLDPAMASGQFVAEIERRLRAIGHSNENIRSRVFGLETSRMQVNIAVNMNELVGTYTVDAGYKTFLSGEVAALRKGWPVKFDIVVGNPPYQNGGSAGNFALWPLFVEKASLAMVDGGHLLFVIPQTWTSNSLSPIARAKDSSLVRANVLRHGTLKSADFSIDRFFNVASTFSAIYWVKEKIDQRTKVITPQGSFDADYNSIEWLPVMGDERIISILNKTVWSDCEKLKLINNGNETPGFRFGKENISREKSNKNKFPIVNTSAQYTKGEYLYSSVKHPFQNSKKVIFSDSGYAAPFFDDGKFGLGHHARAFECTAESAPAIISIVNSSLITFIAKAYLSKTASSWVSLIADTVPVIPRAMSDDEIFAYFKLSPAEVALIKG